MSKKSVFKAFLCKLPGGGPREIYPICIDERGHPEVVGKNTKEVKKKLEKHKEKLSFSHRSGALEDLNLKNLKPNEKILIVIELNP